MTSGIIFGNKTIDVVFMSMFIAQIYKVISTVFKLRKFSWARMWETGGMPSSHSSSVTALATAVAITQGANTPDFAICVVFSIVVMFDAAGIRKAAGDHAGLLNQFTEFFNNTLGQKFKDEKLKELLGHSHAEVLVGALLGVLVAYVMKPYLLS